MAEDDVDVVRLSENDSAPEDAASVASSLSDSEESDGSSESGPAQREVRASRLNRG